MNSSKKTYKFDTLAVHGGQEPDPGTLARGVPIHRTSSFIFRDAKHAADLFALKELGYIYTRLTNPTSDILEKRMAALDNGVGALAVASGTSAIFYSLVNIMESGEEIVSASNLYGGTYTMFNDILPRFGITVRFVDYRNHQQMRDAINSKTRAIFIETIGNPRLGVPDFDRIADIARDARVPLIVDSTFTTPYIFRPLEHGADVVIHSLTKWIGGHGTGIGGVVIDAGKFDWSDPRFRLFTEPEKSYAGVRFGSDLGDLQPMAFIIRMRTVPLRNLGACISPDNSWIFLQGLETLFLRMERHCSNALAVAKFLQEDSRVEWVRYPGLEGDPSYEMTQKYFFKGLAGGVVVFGPKGGPSAAEAFIDRLKLFSHLANVGDAKSLAIHPASTTHSQLSAEQQSAGGLSPDLVRLSVGIEDAADIIEDLDQALG
ncbi:MAG: O-acetylhomoserine aminocarboxypropyltransferase/cysteine synthase [Desulfomonile tiedjei]|uniref:O-acetylhomoserine aminocarboxypropyltransferase/cysteine synthase n=1 Tax=Desulfomonile tiedjei TaxID=2358 RepID=A0A9D6V6H2_9BACT|nr:O-acetylhomoserine aminocarboxypropyltransferase/cysteine synthase [Desulfomonile tiedjei]